MTKKSVFSRKIARNLCNMGFKIVDVQPNNNKPWLNVYYFEHTPRLIKAFDTILSKQTRLRSD